MTRKILKNDAQEIKELVDILQPENIICLGLDTSVAVIQTLINAKFTCKNFSGLIGDGSPYPGDCYAKIALAFVCVGIYVVNRGTR